MSNCDQLKKHLDQLNQLRDNLIEDGFDGSDPRARSEYLARLKSLAASISGASRAYKACTNPPPLITETGINFQFKKNNLPFINPNKGVPSWSTFTETFGEGEIYSELLPIWGSPVLTLAFFAFYDYYLKGKGNGGLATGFCSAMSSLVAEKFHRGDTDTYNTPLDSVHKRLTSVQGRMLSYECITVFHDQGLEGISRVAKTFFDIEKTFLVGCNKDNAPLLFFIPSGGILDDNYFDNLNKSHCVMPYKIVYPNGRKFVNNATDMEGVEMYLWDCNYPESANSKVVFKKNNTDYGFEYFANGSTTPTFSNTQGQTLGMMTNGDLLKDVDLPFSGTLGLTRFILDFVLSPADLQLTDASGLGTGNFRGKKISKIPLSRFSYLCKNVYMLPNDRLLTRRIVGNAKGVYTYNSIMPDATGSIVLQDVPTQIEQIDTLLITTDGNQFTFTPAVEKSFNTVISRKVGQSVCFVKLSGIGGSPTASVEITTSADLSLLRLKNLGKNRVIELDISVLNPTTHDVLTKNIKNIAIPEKNQLLITIADWVSLKANTQISHL
jgi:hypothetical protein